MRGNRSNRTIEGQHNTDNNNRLTMFEKITLIISIFAILISVYSTQVSLDSSRNLTDYQIKQQMEQQILFDKKGAAQQFVIEISSINPLIQNYAHCYFNNFDITSKGKNIFIDRDVTTHLIIKSNNKTLTRTPFLLLLNNNTVIDARSIITPMSVDENGNVSYNIGHGESNSIYDCVLSNPIIPSQLYSEHGMYYVYVQDIPKFNSKLAYDLDMFYYEISSAEANRKYLQEYLTTQEGVQGGYVLENQYFVAYMDMRVNIMKASKLAPTIIEELNEEISKNNNRV